MIGQETIDRVRQQTGIVAVIGESVKLQRRGRTHVGLCPFHQEKTPSFHVNEERGFYHCFGCGASGDVFKFVQETQGLGFAEAVELLAQRAGIEIVATGAERDASERASQRRREQHLYDINASAASYFERMLDAHPLGHHARTELERRALRSDGVQGGTADALQAFRIGYAPWGWQGLVEHLRGAGLSLQGAELVGLLVPRKQGAGHYDRFRHRLMFAVLDLSGRVIAFSGRALPEPEPSELGRLGLAGAGAQHGEAAPAKYVNSPESPIYRKREAVFGLYQARQAVRAKDECVLVEGNFDVVSLHARGIRHVVAPLGTAFTPEQARQIRRFTQRITLLFDGDQAGRRAVRSAKPVCAEVGLTARVAVLPGDTDPDSFIREAGPERLLSALSAARDMTVHLVDQVLDGTFSLETAAEQLAALGEVQDLLREESDATLREMAEKYASMRISERLALTQSEERTIQALVRRIKQAQAASASGPARPPAAPAVARCRDRRHDIPLEILGALLDYPELLDDPEVATGLVTLEGDVAGAVAALRQASSSGDPLGQPEPVLAKLAPAIHPFAAARLAAPRHDRLESARVELLDNVKKLRLLEQQRQRSQAVEETQRAARAGDFDHELEVLREVERRERLRRRRTEGP
ncbi:MAG: toprim domain-containing protein [Polyangiaceae bacterium]|nr:toprim domain-containing protein [Polyangiaceae bacterium]